MRADTEREYEKLVQMIETFVSGSDRSRALVAKIEELFATSPLDDDERFSDFQSALSLFGAGKREDATLLAKLDAGATWMPKSSSVVRSAPLIPL